MNRRVIIRVLLSLLLLLSQQMAASHAMSHWTGKLGQTGALAGQAGIDGSSSYAQHPTCEDCLAFAQLPGTIGSSPVCIAALANQTFHVAQRANQGALARTTCHFHSRAPPVSA